MSETKLKLIFNSLVGLMAWIFAYTGVNAETMFILAVLLAIDWFVGISKAYVVKEQVTSKRSINGILSKASLLIIPIAVGLGAKAIHMDAEILLNTCINLLILSEVYSIIGNVYAMKTGENLPEMDAVSMIGERIRKTMEKFR